VNLEGNSYCGPAMVEHENREDKPTSQDVSYSDIQAYQATQANLSLSLKFSETYRNAIQFKTSPSGVPITSKILSN
jgi:hypothetical protein